ncbi:MAG: Flp pilus assembly complex ATPase component TadA [Phycisphaerales bacterium]|nr:Flp pilus assembly complex ATPase component TadA [Phycisphaerales bacterium]
MKRAMLSLRLTPIRGEAQPVRLGHERVSIGRHPDNTICIIDDRASRFHCVVTPDGKGGYTVRDLKSRNGTKVNDIKIEEVPLQAGDVLRIGQHEFLVEKDEPDGPSEAFAESVEALDESRGDMPAQKDSEGFQNWAAELLDILDWLPPKVSQPEPVSIIDAGGKASDALASSSAGPGGVRLLLQVASKSRATDIHLEPKGDRFHVRVRVDGQMVHIVDMPNRVGELIYGLVKTACQMKTAARDAVQEGHFSSRFPDRRVEYRVSFTPSVHGQKLVLRVLDHRGVPESLASLGLAGYMTERIQRVCDQDHGLLLVCGPTGSGKTTTLYNALRTIDRTTRNVVTIEDPVEYQLDNVTQIPADDSKGNTFSNLLRSVLRQDPDVILVGEIRDEETARTAMQAAMTGHLVFTTVHAKDTIAAVFRLLDLKVEPYLVANSLDLVLAQRLVRQLCEHCKRPVTVSPGTATRLGRYLSGKTTIYSATGCARCLKTGYRGRRGIFELLDFNDELRDVVLREPTIVAMKKIIEQGLFTTLAQFGWRLIAEGVTTIDEVDRVAGHG